jgi:uncharacterized protein with FMN-binding domain
MQKFKKTAVILAAFIVIVVLSLVLIANRIVSDAKALSVEAIDFAQMADGQYFGHYEIFPVKVSVEVKIRNGKMTQIDLSEHFNGMGTPAEKIADHMIEKQSLQVDSISGATVSSMAIKKAVEEALLGK